MKRVIAITTVLLAVFFGDADRGGIAQGPRETSAGLPLIYLPSAMREADRLKKAGIENLVVDESQAEFARREKLPVPKLGGRVDVASATRRPWIDANGWRFIRNPKGKFYYELSKGMSPLAIFEAFAYSADAVLKIDPADLPADLEELGKVYAFLRGLKSDRLPPIADFAVIDDRSPAIGEVMNLLTRRNLLYTALPSPSPRFAVNIKLGTQEFPASEAVDPSEFAQKIRRRIGDDNRSVRIYGSEVVIGRLTGGDKRIFLHLINYSGREVEGLRVRLRGTFDRGEAIVYGYRRGIPEDLVKTDGATEFTISRMGQYAVVDLSSGI